MKIAIIGTGLSSYGSIKAMIDKKIKPYVFDIGLEEDKIIKKLKKQLQSKNPNKWSKNELSTMESFSKTKNTKPRKYFFGSNYIYKFFSKTKESLTFTNALGGFGNIWSASALVPQESDLNDWPKKCIPSHKDYLKVCENLPYSAYNDSISKKFKHPKQVIEARINYSEKIHRLKNKLDKVNDKDFLTGYARNFVEARNSAKNKCRYCGFCNTGCAYNSIFNPRDEVIKLSKNGKIFLKTNLKLEKFEVYMKKVLLTFMHSNKKKKITFDKVFLASGAVNTTKIIVNSLDLYEREHTLKHATFVVMPSFNFSKNKFDWPNSNTLSSIFIEFKTKLIRKWSHCQVNEPNEIIMSYLKYFKLNKFFRPIFSFILSKILIVMVQLHSKYGGIYKIKFNRDGEIETKHQLINHKLYADNLFTTLRNKLAKINIYMPKLLIKYGYDNDNFYIGGSFPFSVRSSKMHTDINGSLKNFKNIHIVDSTTFPSIPGTSFGILLMANSYRIANKILKK